MQVALISDIHANAVALRTLGHILSQVDVVICLGDITGYYCEVNEVLDLLRTYNPICVLGNHDYFLLNGCPNSAPDHVKWAVAYGDKVISKNHREYLAALPHVWGGEVGRLRFLLSHGSPWRPLTDYLYCDKLDINALRQFDVDVIAFGQTHRLWFDKSQRPLLINAGSVGQSRHVPGRACAIIIDVDTMQFHTIEKPYDPTPIIDLSLLHGAKDWVFKHFANKENTKP